MSKLMKGDAFMTRKSVKPSFKMFRQKKLRLKLVFLAIILIVLSVIFLRQLSLRKKTALLNNLRSEVEKIQSENEAVEKDIENLQDVDSDDNSDSERVFSILPR